MPLGLPAATVIGAGISAASNLASGFIGSRGNAPTYYDQLRMQADRSRLVQEQFSKDFRSYAKNMGISPYALLGYSMPSGPAGAAVQSDTRPDLGQALRRMGQDAARGINNYAAAVDLETNKELRLAQARLYNAQADKIINSQTQEAPGQRIIERDIPLHEDYQRYEKELSQRGVNMESQLTLDPMSGYVKYYPSQDIMDLISESNIAAASYYSGMAKYKFVMSKGNANTDYKSRVIFEQEKRQLESRLGQPVYWTGARWRIANKRY